MYSSVGVGVKRATAIVALLQLLALGAGVNAQGDQLACDEGLAMLWTPRHPQLGRYEVCTTPRPLKDIAQAGWTIETVPPLDVFGTAGSYDRAKVARLYGGRYPSVAHGWLDENGRFQAITLVSPYPNRQLTALEPGTLVIRYFVYD
jgi:hypothetical protein